MIVTLLDWSLFKDVVDFFQIEACFKIMGVPQIDMSEMTGNVAVNIRKEAWKQKRIFFLTPQVTKLTRFSINTV